jgi:hypothetical protein
MHTIQITPALISALCPAFRFSNYQHDHIAHGFPMIAIPLYQEGKKGRFTDDNVAYSPTNGSPLAWETQLTQEQGCPEPLRLNLATLLLPCSSLPCSWYEQLIHGLACQPTETCARLSRVRRGTRQNHSSGTAPVSPLCPGWLVALLSKHPRA